MVEKNGWRNDRKGGSGAKWIKEVIGNDKERRWKVSVYDWPERVREWELGNQNLKDALCLQISLITPLFSQPFSEPYA